VLISQETHTLLGRNDNLKALGPYRLKDLVHAQPLYQLGDEEFPPLRTLHQTNLPVQPTPLIGREIELGAILDLLENTRLLTLTGVGGCGKTRLALQAAAELVDDYEDGVWWVSLSALRDPALVEPTIAQVLGASAALADHVRDKHTLLLLDNFEHLLDAAPRIASLLREAADVQVLATSRERLALSVEQEYSVPTLVQGEAVALFTARARQLKPTFRPDDNVAEICTRLDGLPLALELAAARVKVLTPREILERLENSLTLLTEGNRDAPNRHRTLRATIEWSYDLLNAEEQQLFPRLAVFAGGFSVTAAETVCGVELDVLQSLLDKNLIRQTDEGRFFLLETIREFALHMLGDDASLERRHALWCAELAETAEQRLYSSEQANVFEALNDENHNLLAALEWTMEEEEDELLLRILSPLGYFWSLRGYYDQIRPYVARALAAPVLPGLERLRVHVLLTAIEDARLRRDLEDAATLVDEASELAQRCGDDSLIGRTMSAKGVIAAQLGDLDRSGQLQNEALEHYRAAGDEWGEALVLSRLADRALRTGDFPSAEHFAIQALKVAQGGGEDYGIGMALVNVALSVLEQGRFEEATKHAAAAIGRFTVIGEPEATSVALDFLAASVEPSNPSEAGQLLALATALRDPVRTTHGPLEQAVLERTLDRVTARLGEERLLAFLDGAGKLDPTEAMAEAARRASTLVEGADSAHGAT
jgi:predicted ATPase